MNALDSILAQTDLCHRSYEYKRITLIEKLRNIPGLTESMTYKNFKSACNNRNQDLALKILHSHALEFHNNYDALHKSESPLFPVLYIGDCNIIRQTLEIFLEKLNFDQLNHIEWKTTYFESSNPALEKVIDEVKNKVAERMKFLKNKS